MSETLAPPPPDGLQRAPVPRFSLLIAVYQAAHTIGQAIESALAQSTPPHEVIVCDDGSSDAIDDALAPYRDRIVLLREPHRGVAAAKNAALRAATGDYVAILDADDVYLPGRLAALGHFAAARPDLQILTTDAYLEASGGVLRRYYGPHFPFPVTRQRTAILERNFVLGLAAVPRERLLELGGFDESMGSAVDWDCWIRLILAGGAAGLVAEPLARYRLQPTGLSSQRALRMAGRLRAVEKALASPDLRPEERPVAERSLAAQRRELALAHARVELLERRPGLRRRWLAIARDGGFPLPVRLRAGATVVLPALARRRMRLLERGGWVTAGGIRIPR